MGQQMKGLLYFYFADVRHSLAVFWTILMSIVVITLTIAYFLKDVEGGFMALSLTGPMYVYCAILGFLTVKESIPFALKRGATRKNIFLSMGIFFLSLAIAKALIANTLQIVIESFSENIGIDNFTFFHLSYFTNDAWIHRILIDTTVMFFCFAVMFVIGLLFYRYGLAIGGSFIGLVIIIILTGIAQGWLTDYFIDLFKTFDTIFYFELFGIGLIVYILSMLFLKRITILKAR